MRLKMRRPGVTGMAVVLGMAMMMGTLVVSHASANDATCKGNQIVDAVKGCGSKNACSVKKGASCQPGCTSLVSAPGMKLRQGGEFAPLLIEGERLEFEISYGGIPAGKASLEVTGMETARGEVLRITSRAQSNNVISVFFRVDDRLIAEVDAATLESKYFEKRLREGPFEKDEWATYGHSESGGVVRTKDREYAVDPGTRDILSALYYVRGQDLKVGEDVTFNTFEGGKNYVARVKVIRSERLSVGDDDIDCLVIEPEIKEGAFAKTGNLQIWVTDDDLKVPVLMKSKVAIGSFVAKLVRSSHEEGV